MGLADLQGYTLCFGLKDVFHIPAFGEHTDRGNPLDGIVFVVHPPQDGNVAFVLVGRGNDQDLRRRLLLADLLLLGKEINQFFGEALAGGNVLGNQDGDGFHCPVLDGLVLNVIVVDLLELLVLAS